MRTQFSKAVVSFLLVSSVLSGCASTSSTGDAALNQGNWPICSAIGALAGGGLGAIESSAWAGGGAAIGALFGGLICYAQDGDEDGDGVHDRQRHLVVSAGLQVRRVRRNVAGRRDGRIEAASAFDQVNDPQFILGRLNQEPLLGLRGRSVAPAFVDRAQIQERTLFELLFAQSSEHHHQLFG